jgi:hypothetical protein
LRANSSLKVLLLFKLYNRLNKSTIKIISYLKSWGLFKDELEEVKGEEKKQEKKDFEEGNLVSIEEKWYLSSFI